MSTKRKLRDIYSDRTVDTNLTCDILGLVIDIDKMPKNAEIDGWTEAQKREVINWAMRVHIRASDNRNLVPPVPAIISHLFK